MADLSSEASWHELTNGKDYIQHIVSPFLRETPKREQDLIGPAKMGTLHILKAAAENKVKRVVMTSSSGSFACGRRRFEPDKIFTEADWTDKAYSKDITSYYKRKKISEKAAWDFIGQDDTGLELVTVCPGAILGPVFEPDFGTSWSIVISLMNGTLPALPKIEVDLVDVRSVADLQIKAMEMPKAASNRYIAASAHATLKEVGLILKVHLPGRKTPTAEFPDFVGKGGRNCLCRKCIGAKKNYLIWIN